MKVTKIIVHEGRGYNNPYEAYSNYKQGVTIEALIDEELEPYHACVKRLQEKASEEIEAIKNKTLESLKRVNSLEDAKRQIEIELKKAKSVNEIPF